MVWQAGSPRPVVLIFYSSHRGLKQKSGLCLGKWFRFGLGGISGKD